MGLVVPNPGVPADGQALDATPLAQNLTAVYQAIQSFDGSQVQAGTIAASALATSINPNTLLNDTISPFVKSGCVWSVVSGVAVAMTSGVIYVSNAGQMYRVSVPAVVSHTLPNIQDNYIDIDYNGNIYYLSVANNAAAPTLTANAIRVAKIVTTGGAVTNASTMQQGWDSNNIVIYPTEPYAPTITAAANAGTAGGTMWYNKMGAVRELWLTTNAVSSTAAGATYTVTLPTNYFSTIQVIEVTSTNMSAFSENKVTVTAYSTSSITLWTSSPSGTQTVQIAVRVRGT